MGGRFFSLASLGRREVSDGKTPGASFGARVGYLGSRLGVGKEEEAPINKPLEFPSGLRQFLAGPRGRMAGWHLAELFLKLWEATCSSNDVHFQIIAP